MSEPAKMKTSACVDCATPIIGDRLRCPACHADHAEALSRVPVAVDDPPRRSFGRGLLVWMLAAEALMMAVCGALLVTKGCTP